MAGATSIYWTIINPHTPPVLSPGSYNQHYFAIFLFMILVAVREHVLGIM